MGLRTQDASRTAASVGLRTGWKDQCDRGSSAAARPVVKIVMRTAESDRDTYAPLCEPWQPVEKVLVPGNVQICSRSASTKRRRYGVLVEFRRSQDGAIGAFLGASDFFNGLL